MKGWFLCVPQVQVLYLSIYPSIHPTFMCLGGVSLGALAPPTGKGTPICGRCMCVIFS